MASLWRRAAAPFQEFGPLAGSLYCVDRVLRALSPRLGLYCYEMMVQPIGPQPLLPPNRTRNLRFVEIRRGDSAIALMPARDDIKAERFRQGAHCLGVFNRHDALIGYVWLVFERYHEDEVRATYELADPARSVFDFDLVVLPEHRMGIGFMAVWHAANAWLHARGVRYTFSRMTRFNTASRRAHLRLGGACAARAVFLQAWRFECMVATTAPYFAATWSRRPRLRLAPDALTAAAPPHPPVPPRSEIRA